MNDYKTLDDLLAADWWEEAHPGESVIFRARDGVAVVQTEEAVYVVRGGEITRLYISGAEKVFV